MFINDCFYKYNNKLYLVHEFCKYDVTYISQKYLDLLKLPFINGNNILGEIELCNKYYRNKTFNLNKWEMITKLIIIPDNNNTSKKKFYDLNGLIYNNKMELYSKFIKN